MGWLAVGPIAEAATARVDLKGASGV